MTAAKFLLGSDGSWKSSNLLGWFLIWFSINTTNFSLKVSKPCMSFSAVLLCSACLSKNKVVYEFEIPVVVISSRATFTIAHVQNEKENCIFIKCVGMSLSPRQSKKLNNIIERRCIFGIWLVVLWPRPHRAHDDTQYKCTTSRIALLLHNRRSRPRLYNQLFLAFRQQRTRKTETLSIFTLSK